MVAHSDLPRVPAAQQRAPLPASVYKSLFEHARTPMVIHDLAGWLLDANQAYAELLGYSVDEVIGLHSSDVLHPDDHAERTVEAEQMFLGHIDNVAVHRRHVRKDGSVIDARVRKTVLAGESGGTVVLVVVDHWDVVRELEHSASHDELTGLLNRRGVRDRAALMYPSACAYLAMVDVDGLKGVNDSYGHAAGDRVLRAVGDALRTDAPEGSVVGRWSGDEFVVLTPLVAGDDLAHLLTSAVRRIRLPVDGDLLAVAASVGVTRFDAENETLDVALARADSHMYGHKRRRRR